ncbi:hypothetical protein [Falsiroseomonas selenitidurans]|uniref:Uncharacterized protein n=1 Tax=Falsiroseomonas selenitidurans TaxID=2716335 RepID=A0ABX1DXF3_9PROT|nr:hypothetical protein [Falsiroseomonas selenitidurans]NKC29476.1 hypothetical protein [Falsiroseomonas selenitidurans]
MRHGWIGAIGLAFLLPALALGQGNDATTATSAASNAVDRAAPVGVLTTSSVTTGSSGPPTEGGTQVPEGASWRVRVLAPVCNAVDPALVRECRLKSGMPEEAQP